MRRVILGLSAAAVLAGCGDSGSSTDAPAKALAPKVELTAEQKAALLASLPAPYNTGDLDQGRRVFARCRSCHTIAADGPNMVGPNLYGVFGRVAGTREGFNYSNPLKAAGFAWDAEKLDQWLSGPRTFLPGNKMSFAGIPDAEDRRDLIAYLKVETGYAPQ